jgi:predicted nucleic acid-binding protein
MTEVVVDASIASLWVRPPGTPGAGPAQALLERYEAGDVSVVAPPLLFLELLNVASRRWRWAEAALIELVTRLEGMFTDMADPDLRRVASWTASGLTAYDATYVALAEERSIRLVTSDRQLLAVAPGIARTVDAL